MKLYQLSSKSANPETPDKEWYAKAQSSILCEECSSARASEQPFDIVLQTLPDKSAINFVHGVHKHIASADFLKTLFPEGPSEFLKLGKVFDHLGNQAFHLHSIMVPHQILVRGNERSTYRTCSTCHRIWYSAIGEIYVLRENICGKHVYETQSGNLVVAEHIARRVMQVSWNNLVIRKLSIRETPIDELDIPE